MLQLITKIRKLRPKKVLQDCPQAYSHHLHHSHHQQLAGMPTVATVTSGASVIKPFFCGVNLRLARISWSVLIQQSSTVSLIFQRLVAQLQSAFALIQNIRLGQKYVPRLGSEPRIILSISTHCASKLQPFPLGGIVRQIKTLQLIIPKQGIRVSYIIGSIA